MNFQANVSVEVRKTLAAALLFLITVVTGCGGGSEASTTPPVATPAFMSTPITAATQGVTYSYQIQASPADGVTFSLASAPQGATLNGSTLTWTPTAAESRITNQFSVTATNAGGSATQNWSVTPAGTVSGSFIITAWTTTGAVSSSIDWTKVPGFPMALVPQPNGSFQTVAGSGNSDGTFSIPNMPAGYYWLEPNSTVAYWTSSSTVDLGEDTNEPPPLKVSQSSNATQVTFNFDGLEPTQANDELVFLWDFLPDPSVFFQPTSPFGSTTFVTTTSLNSIVDLSQPTTALALQYEPEAIGSLSGLGLGPSAMLSNVALVNGGANSVNATLISSPQTTFDLNVKGSAWLSLFSNAGPGVPTLLGSNVVVAADVYMPPDINPFSVRASVPLFSGLSPAFPAVGAYLAFTSVCNNTGEISNGFTQFPGEPAITTDQDFGIVQYEDPFPSNWLRVFSFCETASVTVPLPGSATPVSFQIVDGESTSLPTSEISPLIAQVQNPTVNGQSLFVASTVSANGVTLSWNAPTGAVPTGYRILALVAGTLPGLPAIPTYLSAGTFLTTKTSVALPPLQAGRTYVFEITSILDGAANFETRPNRSALPTASATVVSAPITTD